MSFGSSSGGRLSSGSCLLDLVLEGGPAERPDAVFPDAKPDITALITASQAAGETSAWVPGFEDLKPES